MGAGATIAPGTVFAGDYEVERTLAAGGMGAVYVARQRSTQKLRALKTLLPEYVSDPAMRARFAREATVGSRIESDHVVEVIAAGVDEPSGVPWIVMELLAGDDLAGVAAKRGVLPPAEALEAFRQLGHALTAAHRAGVVHRDLKPENLFLANARREGVPFTLKVLDFGIARVTHAASTKHTTSAMGSPLWMAPEQTDSTQPITPATDVWALGLIAFWVLTGTHYWFTPRQPEATIGSMIRELLADPLAPASERAAAFGITGRLPSGFDAWFARCVARDPAARFPSAAEAAPALIALLGGTALPATAALPQHAAPAPYVATQPSAAHPTAPPLHATVPAHPGTLAGPPPVAPQAPAPAAPAARSKGPMIAVVAGLTAALALAIGWALRPRDEATPPPPAPLAATPDAAQEPAPAAPLGTAAELPSDPATGAPAPPGTVYRPRRAPDGGVVYVPVPLDATTLVEPPPTLVEPPPPTLVEPPPTPVEPPPTLVEPPPPTPVEPPPTLVEPPPVIVAPTPVEPTPVTAPPPDAAPTEAPAETGCGRNSGCSACVRASGCGWCNNLNRCVSGHWANGPAGGVCGGNDWVTDGDQCDDHCAGARNCSSCVGTRGCGWCHNLNRCVAGHWANGASHGACGGDNWVTGADRCDDHCARVRDCAACVRERDCGWCANVQRCVSGHWANGPAHGACGGDDWVHSADACR